MDRQSQSVEDEARIKQAWANFVNCQDDMYFGNRTKMEKQLAVLRRLVADARASHHSTPGDERE
jgi:hypothetical protein